MKSTGSMRAVCRHRSGWTVLLITVLLAACGGGGGSAGSGPSNPGGGGSSQQPPPPTASLAYPSGAQTFVIRSAITPVAPTITGTLTAFTITPALPAGLSLDGGKGTISGTPTAISPAVTYTISAIGPGGASASATLSIAVNDDVPPASVSYGTASLSYSATVPSAVLTPITTGGVVASWSINPALPSGLTLDPNTGSISGTPSAPAAPAPYTVTAQNSGGQVTATLTIQVGTGPLLELGHQLRVFLLRATATNALSLDGEGYWILWDYTKGTVVAKGLTGCTQTSSPCAMRPEACPTNPVCNVTPAADLAGSTAVIVTPTGFEVHSTTDGHTLANIAASGTWWRLAADGSYIIAGSGTSLSAWSPSGALLFSHAGDYSQALSFAAPGQILVGGGPAGANVVETIGVPGGTASTSATTFNGTFASWFIDGSRFTTMAGSTLLVYSTAVAQLNSVPSIPANATVVGQGNWFWVRPRNAGVLSIYPVIGSPGPVEEVTIGLATPYASGLTIGLSGESATTSGVIDLSGAYPVKTDYTLPTPLSGATAGPIVGPYAAVSASQWLIGTQDGRLLDGPSLNSTPRYLGLGEVQSIAAGMGHFAIAMVSGDILYFNSATLAQEGQIAYPAEKVLLSADGTVLAALGDVVNFDELSVQTYSLPAGAPLYKWAYSLQPAAAAQDIALSGAGNVLGQVVGTTSGIGYTVQLNPPTGGPPSYSTTFATSGGLTPPILRVSPDGSLLAWSQSATTFLGATTNFVQNSASVATVTGWPAGWLDNSRLVVNSYAQSGTSVKYTGCALYGPNGVITGAPCALPEVTQLQPLTSDTLYAPGANEILTVSTGSVSWMSGDPYANEGWLPSGVAGSNVIFVSGTSLLAQPH